MSTIDDPCLTALTTEQRDIKAVLRSDLGIEIDPNHYELKTFTKKGDSISSKILRAEVSYTENGEKKNVSYVLKLWPGDMATALLTGLNRKAFKKEIEFYSQTLPLLNTELAKLKISPLNIPKYFHSVTDDGHQAIYLEDLISKGYKMIDRTKTMDEEHVTLVLKELAKLHASSILVQLNKGKPSLNMDADDNALLSIIHSGRTTSLFALLFRKHARTALRMGLVEFAVTLIRLSNYGSRVVFSLLKSDSRFKVLCHGDPWINNFLFRYNDSNKPEECMILDYQQPRFGSIALDLNYMFYTSLDDSVRKNFRDFLSTYYSSFSEIFRETETEVPFSLNSLIVECSIKKTFGCFMAMNKINSFLCPPEESLSVEDYLNTTVETLQKKLDKIAFENELIIERTKEILQSWLKPIQ